MFITQVWLADTPKCFARASTNLGHRLESADGSDLLLFCFLISRKTGDAVHPVRALEGRMCRFI